MTGQRDITSPVLRSLTFALWLMTRLAAEKEPAQHGREVAAAQRSMDEARRLIHWPRRSASEGDEPLESTRIAYDWYGVLTSAVVSFVLGSGDVDTSILR